MGAIKEKKKILEERIGVLSYAARWFVEEAEKPSLGREARGRLETMKELLKDVKGAKEEKGIKLDFVQELIKYVEESE